jgi:hypothetical protein
MAVHSWFDWFRLRAAQRVRFAVQWQLLLPISVSILLVLPAHAQDVVGYSAKDTCKGAIDAEIARGSKLIEPPGPPNPVMKDFYGTVEFERTYHGTPAKVIYLCQGTKVSGGSIFAQLIHIGRGSAAAARSEFEQQKQWVEASLGTPCWDPTRLSDAQRAKLRAAGKPAETLGPMTIWKSGQNNFTDVSWISVPNATPPKWDVIVSTHGPADFSHAGEPFLSLYRMSTCERPDPARTSPRAKW